MTSVTEERIAAALERIADALEEQNRADFPPLSAALGARAGIFYKDTSAQWTEAGQ